MNTSCAFTIIVLFANTLATAQSFKSHPLASDASFKPYLLGIVVEDVDRSIAWYQNKLGFRTVKRMNFPEYDSLQIVFLKQGDVELELIEKSSSFKIQKFVPNYNGFDGPFLIGISKITFMISDAAQLANYLKAQDVTFVRGLYDDKDFGVRSFFISDPDGNIFQFNQPLTVKPK